jgi:hypothetical protein
VDRWSEQGWLLFEAAEKDKERIEELAIGE